ncbi:MAG: hypothetical protein WA747_06890 [Steroidobacteraceae bacterium]
MNESTTRALPYRLGEWLPSDQAFLDAWFAGMIEKTAAEQKANFPQCNLGFC